MSQITDPSQMGGQEQHAEHRALALVRGASFHDCLRLNGLPPTIEVSYQGRAVIIRGSDIYDRRTWKKFLESQNRSEEPVRLVHEVDVLVEQYRTWLLTTHTTRYRVLVLPDHLAWLERVIMLAVIRHIMEHKYARSLEQPDAFADPQVALEMTMLAAMHGVMKETARLIHHIVSEPEHASQLIDQLYQVHLQHLRARPQLPRAPLPALPPGATLPGALRTLTDEESGGEVHG